MKKMPEYLFIRKEVDGDAEYFLSFENQNEAVEDDGPTEVTTYKKVSTKKIRKVIQFD